MNILKPTVCFVFKLIIGHPKKLENRIKYLCDLYDANRDTI